MNASSYIYISGSAASCAAIASIVELVELSKIGESRRGGILGWAVEAGTPGSKEGIIVYKCVHCQESMFSTFSRNLVRMRGMKWPSLLSWMRPRYSLRTLFVLMTGIAIWLGWQVGIVRERKNMRVVLEGVYEKPYSQIWNSGLISSGIHPYELSWIRKVLGDQVAPVLCLPSAMTLEQQERFKKVFPEAWIGVAPAEAQK